MQQSYRFCTPSLSLGYKYFNGKKFAMDKHSSLIVLSIRAKKECFIALTPVVGFINI